MTNEKAMSRNEDRGNCLKCRKPLVGAVEVITTTTEGIPTILLRRNIQTAIGFSAIRAV